MISREILEELYIKNKLRASDVALKLNVSTPTIFNYLKRYKIETRGAGYYRIHQKIHLSDSQYEFFDGLMISDGSLVKQNCRNAKISCAFKHKEFAKYIKEYLDIEKNIHKKIHKSNRYKSGECVQYGLFSQNNILFTNERKRWYDGCGKKHIPQDFRFTPISMNIAYLGDGSISNGAALLSFNNFNRCNIEDIIGVNLKNINIKYSICKNRSLRISKKTTPVFLEYIGKCPVDCYKYKWNF